MKTRNVLLCFFIALFAHDSFAQAPIEFIENQGQWGSWFSYKAITQGGDVCLEKDGFRYILSDADNNYKVDYYHHGQTQVKPILKFHAYKVTFVGADIPELQGEKPQKVYYNYYLGDDPSRWKTGIHPVRAVNYNKLYKGIDMHVFSEKGNLEYEFIVQPNADPSQVKLKFEGEDNLQIKNHNLTVNTSVGAVTENKPYVYQYINNERVEVPCEYRLQGNTVSFDFPNGYDHSQQLIIDPVVVLCTLTGSTADNWGYSATYDDAGNFYAGGLVNALIYPGTSFPVSPGAFQVTFGGGYGSALASQGYAYAADISIIKYDPTLKSRIYATYLGGSGNDHVHSMIVDPAGNLVIAGRTISNDFPVTPGAYQTSNHGWWDIVVTKFNASGTALLGSTYIGGSASDGVNVDSTEVGFGQLKYNYGDDSRSEVQIDNSGNIYVASCTNSTNFPTTSTAISSTLKGAQDGVVFKFNSALTSLLWSTYVGGSNYDAAYVLSFDTLQQSLYVGGGTNSTDFPVTAGTFHGTFQGGRADGFILKFDNTGAYNLQKGTYIGTSDYDQVYGIQGKGTKIYAMGQTLGGTFPVTAGTYSNPGSSQFVIELDNNLSTDIASTVFGSGNPTFTNISPVAFLIDTCDNVYISGWGGNLNISGCVSGLCNGMPTTSDGIQLTTDGRDFYFIVLGAGLATLRYGTYYGRSCISSSLYLWMNEHVDGGTSRFDKHGVIYQGICASCGGGPSVPGACPSAFPTTPGVYAPTDGSQNCNEAALEIAFNMGPVTASVTAGPSTSGCMPLTVNFTNTSTNGLTYFWDFGDGTTTTTFSPTHTFNSAGVFTVTISAANSNACFRTNDTARLLIQVDTNVIIPGFTYQLTDSCGPYTASFVNTSSDHAGGSPGYLWLFGDGKSYPGTTPPDHNYPDTGNYTVMLIMSDPAACKSPDTVTNKLSIHSTRVSANFTAPDTICLGTSIIPAVTTTNVGITTWTFGDGTSSSSSDPDYTYKNVGTYTLKIVVINGGTCNGIDSEKQTVTVLPTPTANFSFTPQTPIPNVPVTYTNLSVLATRYSWDFGDNTGSTEVNPIHQYDRTGTYTTCLKAFNESNCPSVACKQVPTDVEPLIGLPTAFTPNGDGENDILYVRGAAIKTLDLKIYNRWGQLVFETTDQKIGWDGTFNGQPQPIEAYAYVLHATFIDGSAKLLKGNVTLLR